MIKTAQERAPLESLKLPPVGGNRTENVSTYLKQGVDIVPQNFLFMPGDNSKVLKGLVEKPALSGAHAILDLEDGIKAKGEAPRRTLIEFLNANAFLNQVIAIRANSPITPVGAEDLAALMQHQELGGAANRFDALVIPKVETADEIYRLADYLSRAERSQGWEQRVKLELLIESPKGVRNIDAIVEAVCTGGRGAGVMFGVADYAKELGNGVIRWDFESFRARFGDVIAEIGCAARAYGLHAIAPIDTRIPQLPQRTPHDKAIRDEIIERIRWAHELGYEGALAIHPNQLPIIAQAFAPAPHEAEFHIDRLDAFLAGGGGSVVHEGEMVDLPIALASFKLMEAAAAAGIIERHVVKEFTQRFSQLIQKVAPIE